MSSAVREGDALPASKPDKIVEIECLRAVAIVFTLVAHYRVLYGETPRWVQWMDARVAFHGGVDLFFVISGFVISRNLIPAALALVDARSRAQFVTRFWVRRAFRLWPSSWLWAGLGVAVIALTNHGVVGSNLREAGIAVLQLFNVYAYACEGSTMDCAYEAVGVYWSLSLEEQFYLVLPVLLVVARARAKWVMTALLAAGVFVSSHFPVIGSFFRWEAFCIGVLLAWLYGNKPLLAKLEARLIKPLGRFVWVISWATLLAIPKVGAGVFGIYSYPMLAVCAGVLVALAALDHGHLGIPRRLHPPLVWIGARSYSIYLAHSAVFLVFKFFSGLGWRDRLPFGTRNVLWILVPTALVFFVSHLNFRYVESRFRHLAQGKKAVVPAPVALPEAGA